MDDAIELIRVRIQYILANNPPTGGVADIVNQGRVKELKFILNLLKTVARSQEEGE